jgi:hypothetical protein
VEAVAPRVNAITATKSTGIKNTDCLTAGPEDDLRMNFDLSFNFNFLNDFFLNLLSDDL